MIKAEKGTVLIKGKPDELRIDMICILQSIKSVSGKMERARILSSISEVIAGVAPESKTVTIDKEELLQQLEEEKGNA